MVARAGALHHDALLTVVDGVDDHPEVVPVVGAAAVVAEGWQWHRATLRYGDREAAGSFFDERGTSRRSFGSGTVLHSPPSVPGSSRSARRGTGLLRRGTRMSMGSLACRRAVAITLERTSWVAAPSQVKFPPQDLRFTTRGLIACSAFQLHASTSPRAKEGEQVGTLVGKMLEEPHVGSVVVAPGEQGVHPLLQRGDRRREGLGGAVAPVPCRPETHGVLQDVLEGLRNLSLVAGGVLDHAHHPPEPVRQTALVDGIDELA